MVPTISKVFLDTDNLWVIGIKKLILSKHLNTKAYNNLSTSTLKRNTENGHHKTRQTHQIRMGIN
jgi:hypothetical protein